MKRSTITAVLFLMFSLLLWSCSKEGKSTQVSPNLPATSYDYRTDHKDKIIVTLWPTGNEMRSTISGTSSSWVGIAVTNGGATLGRVIFYDNGNTITINSNCSGCHSAPPVFGDKAGLVRQNNNDLAAIHAQAGVESADRMVERMKAKSFYAQLFKDAYGTSEITPDRITDALSQYMTAMAGVSSKEALAADPRFADPFK